MDPDLKDRILALPRARELAAWQPPEPTVRELRAKYGGESDEELLLRYFLTPDEIAAMRAAGRPRDYPFDTAASARGAVERFTRRRDYSHIRVRSPGFALSLSRQPSLPTPCEDDEGKTVP